MLALSIPSIMEMLMWGTFGLGIFLIIPLATFYAYFLALAPAAAMRSRTGWVISGLLLLLVAAGPYLLHRHDVNSRLVNMPADFVTPLPEASDIRSVAYSQDGSDGKRCDFVCETLLAAGGQIAEFQYLDTDGSVLTAYRGTGASRVLNRGSIGAPDLALLFSRDRFRSKAGYMTDLLVLETTDRAGKPVAYQKETTTQGLRIPAVYAPGGFGGPPFFLFGVSDISLKRHNLPNVSMQLGALSTLGIKHPDYSYSDDHYGKRTYRRVFTPEQAAEQRVGLLPRIEGDWDRGVRAGWMDDLLRQWLDLISASPPPTEDEIALFGKLIRTSGDRASRVLVDALLGETSFRERYIELVVNGLEGRSPRLLGATRERAESLWHNADPSKEEVDRFRSRVADIIDRSLEAGWTPEAVRLVFTGWRYGIDPHPALARFDLSETPDDGDKMREFILALKEPICAQGFENRNLFLSYYEDALRVYFARTAKAPFAWDDARYLRFLFVMDRESVVDELLATKEVKIDRATITQVKKPLYQKEEFWLIDGCR